MNNLFHIFFVILVSSIGIIIHVEASSHILFPPYQTDELRNTNNALQNVESVNFFACQGDILDLDGCHAGSYGDTRMRLYLEGVGGLREVNENDDYCDLISNHKEYQVSAPGCNLYRLDMGCYQDEVCGLNVTGTCAGECHPQPTLLPTMEPSGEAVPTSSHPTMEPTIFPFAYQTGELSNTLNGFYNVESVHFQLCGAQDVYLNACDGSIGDGFLRLYREDNGKDIQVAENDDFCDLSPRIHYGLLPGEACHSYRLDMGCRESETCSIHLNAYCDGCTTPQPTKAPTIPGTMFYYFDDNYRCDDDNKRKDMHHMELQAFNYVCLALDTCTKVGSQLYIKATLHYTTENFLDYQSSSYFMNPAPNTITYYPDENCMYPIADVNSDCSNASHECCQLGSVNLMGNDLPIMGENGFVPAIMSWPDNCEPQPLDDNNDAVPDRKSVV